MLICLLLLAFVGTLSSIVYCFLAVRAASGFKENHNADPGARATEPISVIKPVYGEDPGLEQNLITFYEQNYPEFELLFCSRWPDDPALAVVRRLAVRYPHVSTRIVTSGEPTWPNARAYSVNTALAEAAHSLVVITDSDVRVGNNFLADIARPLEDRSVGLVTALYRGVSLGGFWSNLEALGMSVELMSNVLIANMLHGMDFALGPATATRREHIEKIGGLEESGRYYADDFALGKFIDQSGLKVVLADSSIEHIVPTSTFAGSLRHQMLWMKNNRYLRPKGHLGVGLTFAMPYALLGSLAAWASGHLVLSVAWLACGILNCVIRCVAVGWQVVDDQEALRRAWLYPARDLFGFIVWLGTWFGNKINFRGDRYVILHSGKVQRVRP
jgi:ceramide glucosyltransferase